MSFPKLAPIHWLQFFPMSYTVAHKNLEKNSHSPEIVRLLKYSIFHYFRASKPEEQTSLPRGSHSTQLRKHQRHRWKFFAPSSSRVFLRDKPRHSKYLCHQMTVRWTTKDILRRSYGKLQRISCEIRASLNEKSLQAVFLQNVFPIFQGVFYRVL